MKPINDFVLVSVLEPDALSSRGIFIPATVEKNLAEGEVKEASAGYTLDSGVFHSLQVKENDKILFDKSHARPFKQNGLSLLVIREADIVAKL